MPQNNNHDANDNGDHEQCDQCGQIIFQYWAIDDMETCPIA